MSTITVQETRLLPHELLHSKSQGTAPLFGNLCMHILTGTLDTATWANTDHCTLVPRHWEYAVAPQKQHCLRDQHRSVAPCRLREWRGKPRDMGETATRSQVEGVYKRWNVPCHSYNSAASRTSVLVDLRGIGRLTRRSASR